MKQMIIMIILTLLNLSAQDFEPTQARNISSLLFSGARIR
jgi:hypothetical protein